MSSVVPGTVLNIYVGGQGLYGVSSGGFNGGGDSTYASSCSGGGATDVRTGTDLSTRIAVAGGGGGADAFCPSSGGDAGNPSGSVGGYSSTNCGSGGTGGGGATQSAGGAAGNNPQYGSGLPGTLGTGGKGCSGGGSGGGGGYYGGGGTCSAAGGGGSSYCSSSMTNAVFTDSFNYGQGYAILEYQIAVPSAVPTLAPSRPTVAPTYFPLSTTFAYTGDVQQYVVPPNAIAVTVHLFGAGGGDMSSTVLGGKGGKVDGTFTTLAPGTILYIYVGGGGTASTSSGGFNGGGASTYSNSASGGGATDVRTSTSLSSRIAVAGGGGGSDLYCSNSGGGGAYPSGVSGGFVGCTGASTGNGGGGGSQNAGGIAGYSSGYGTGNAGSFGIGAKGGSCSGPGGGGGYYGGGSTCGGGAGGGSSYFAASGAVFTNALNIGNGLAVIEYTPAPPSAAPTVAPSNPTAVPTIVPTAAPTFYPAFVAFGFTGGVQQYMVPPNAVSLTLTLFGASGGNSSATAKGGRGGRTKVTIPTSAIGSILYVYVGGQGVYGKYPGGFNGGGASTFGNSGSGGGATDVRTSTSVTSRIAVAGGGGGSDGYCANNGGDGGNPSGTSGGVLSCTSGVLSGGGGSQTAGGTGGSGSYGAGADGSLGQGADGTSCSGPGGGGGYYGGGSTCGGGAGGGSSYSTYQPASYTTGMNFGNGYATIEYTAAPSAPPTRAPSASPTTTVTRAPTGVPTLAPTANPSAAATVARFNFTGSLQTYQIPANAGTLIITAVGAGGGGGLVPYTPGKGGKMVVTTTNFTPGSILYIDVGQAGGLGGAGGYGGGGTGTCSQCGTGGGGTYIKTSASATIPAISVGGGGGADSRTAQCAGSGGSAAPNEGMKGLANCANITAASGGSLLVAIAGRNLITGQSGTVGTASQGGSGCLLGGGAGGGGGYRGGSGACGGGGGGGSSFNAMGGTSVSTLSSNAGDGYVTISYLYAQPSTAPTLKPTVRPTVQPSVNPTSAPTFFCPAGWVVFRTQCYLFAANNPNTNMSCSDTCASIGAGMMCIQNAAQNSFITNYVNPYSPLQIGLSRAVDRGAIVYRWDGNCTSSYTNNGASFLGTKQYVSIGSDGYWTDSDVASAMTCGCQTTTSSFAPSQTVFYYTGGIQTYTIPVDAMTLTVTAIGASGANGVNFLGGLGAQMTATVTVTPANRGKPLYLFVGGSPSSVGGGGPGYNGGGFGGGNGYGSGGGSSDVRFPTSSLGSRVLVAGGGGGADDGSDDGSGNNVCSGSGGNAGYEFGASGQVADGVCDAPTGGTQTSGGVQGFDGYTGEGGLAGTRLTGGSACGINTGIGVGAGGGGGYYGGGGSCGGGGGGGSSYTNYTDSTSFSLANQRGNGVVIISYTHMPSAAPTARPTSSRPSPVPSAAPTASPTASPSLAPSAAPSSPLPTATQTAAPSAIPSTVSPSSAVPSGKPVLVPTAAPILPTAKPTLTPIIAPTLTPTAAPSPNPTRSPSPGPSPNPTMSPTNVPTVLPSEVPSFSPTAAPSAQPTKAPTAGPTANPSAVPSLSPTTAPSLSPSAVPTAVPSRAPSTSPTEQPSADPSALPTALPTFVPSRVPTHSPSMDPSASPSAVPTEQPSTTRTASPTILNQTPDPSAAPTASPSAVPTALPTSSSSSAAPTPEPSTALSRTPTSAPSHVPTASPSAVPSERPSELPTSGPSASPTVAPSADPTLDPTTAPTFSPSVSPTVSLTAGPSHESTHSPSAFTTTEPTDQPSVAPTFESSVELSLAPTVVSSDTQTAEPSAGVELSAYPSVLPTESPTLSPSDIDIPVAVPVAAPVESPTAASEEPSPAPSAALTSDPSPQPTAAPSHQPVAQPSRSPSVESTLSPSDLLTAQPSAAPSRKPAAVPTARPTAQPIVPPSKAPTANPTALPTAKPTLKPSVVPSTDPSAVPTWSPSLAAGATGKPSAGPTAAPTLSQEALWRSTLSSVLTASAATATSQTSAHRATYYELDVGTASPVAVYGSCASWKSLLSGDLSSSQLLYAPSAIQLTVQSSLTGNSSSVTCADKTSTKSILSALLSTTASSSAVSVTCAKHQWVVQQCSGSVPQLCIDCSDPCSTTAHCANDESYNAFTVSPCVTAACGSTPSVRSLSDPTVSSALRLLSVTYRDLQPAPSVLSTSVVPGKTALTVTSTLSARGSVFCAAYQVDAATGVASAPASVAAILLQNFGASTNAANSTSVTITGLSAASDYQVYCVSVFPSGTQMSLAAAIAQTVRATTACCIAVAARASSAAVLEGSPVASFVSLAVEARPAESVALTINTYKVVNGAARLVTPSPFFPSTFTLSTLQQSTSVAAVTFTSSLSTLSAGSYTYNVSVSGASARQFAVTFPSGTNALTVLPVSSPLPAPVLSSAQFSNDGSNVAIAFNANTDRANGGAASFACNSLLSFACAATSTCKWSSDASVVAVISSAAGCAGINSTVTLASSAVVKAKCQQTSGGCDTAQWPSASTSTSVRIASPSTAVSPTVAISAPATIGECDSLVLDLSGSSGNGGRDWQSRTIQVETLATKNATDLQFFLQHTYQSSPPTPIPAALLSKGFAYSFQVTLCNFLGKCGQATKRVLAQSSTVPVVSLPGSALRRVKRNGMLTVGSSAFYALCNTGTSTNGLGYSWTVSSGGAVLLGLVSTSKDPSKLVLPAYSLQTNTLYDIALKATITSSQQSATTAMQVFVDVGSIVPVVALGSSRTMRVEQTLNIDASSSYDEDQSGVTGVSAGLQYSWSCVQTSPVLSASCDGIFSSAGLVSGRPALFQAVALSSAANTVVQVTVMILDSTASRTASSTVTVSVLPSLSPVVSVVSNAASGVINANQELQITGTVSFPAAFNGTATWSLGDTGVALSSIAKTSLTTAFSASSVVVQNQVYLVLSTSSLPQGAALTFLLTARTPSSNLQSVASVVVTINSPPQPGAFRVTPRSGTELSDVFTFLAERWFDTDLPLLYQFSYQTGGGVDVTLRSKAETSFGTAMLPAGPSGSNYSVTCGAQVFDSLSASSSAQFAVTVKKAVIPATTNSTAAYIAAGLEDGFSNADALKQATALGGYLLNDVDCSLAPDCALLNRADCLQTTQTCGACLSSAFLGEDGDSNEPCVSVNSARRLTAVSADCSASPDVCGLFQTCRSGLCVSEPKQCQANCSSPLGSCVFVDVNSGASVPTCYMGATDCAAVCNCTAGYEDSATCSLTNAEVQQKRALRTQLLAGAKSVVNLEDADLESVTGWINTLTVLSQVPDELSEDSISALWDMISNVTSSGNALSLSYTAMSGLLSTVNAATQAVSDRALQSRRRLGSAEGNSSAQAVRAADALNTYRQYVSSQLLPGQDAVQALYPQFRLHVENRALSSRFSAGNVTAQLPSSALEGLNGQAQSSINIPADSLSLSPESSALRISVSSMRSQLLNDELSLSGYKQLYSNPLALELAGLPCADPSSCRYELVLQTSSLGDALSVRSPPELFNTTCEAGDFSTYVHTCSGGQKHTATCNGTAAVWMSQCPVSSYSPVCSALAGLDVTSTACTVVSKSDTSITCSCPVPFPADRRSLATGNATVITQAISYVALLSAVESNFVTTILSAQNLNANSLEKGWSVIVTIGVFAMVVLFGLQWSYKADIEVNKVKPSAKDQAMKTAVTKTERRSNIWKKQQNIMSGNSDMKMAEEALPTILSSSTLSNRITDEMKHHHKWFGIVFYYSRSFPRVLRVISLATNVLIMLFIQSLTYTLTNPDDGACEQLNTESSCLQPKSPYATGQSKCYWNPANADACTFVQPDSDLTVILFVAIFSAVVSTPLAIFVDWIIMRILASPIKTVTKNRTGSDDMIPGAPGQPLTSVVVGTSSPVNESPAPPFARKRGGNFRLASLFGADNEDALVTENNAKLQAQTDLRLLVLKILTYRTGLNDRDRSEFDAVWGLDETGHFKTDEENSSKIYGVNYLTSLFSTSSSKNVATGSVSQRVLMDLANVHSSMQVELENAKTAKLSAKERGKRLMYLFQCDLLPGVSGKILESKSSRDNIRAEQVSWEAKFAGWGFISLLNLGMLAYIFLFALNQTTHRQSAWALSFALWLVVEILLVSSLTVLFTHVMVPSLIMGDVNKIKSKLVDSIRTFNATLRAQQKTGSEKRIGYDSESEDEDTPFSSTDFLFLSSRLAKQWPNLREAKIIAQFKTPWPKQSYQRETNVSGMYSKKFSALSRSGSILIIYFVSNMVQVPPGLQDMVINIFTTSAIGYTVLLHMDLYKIFPLLVIIPFSLVCVIVHFIIQANKAESKLQMTRLLSTDPEPKKGKSAKITPLNDVPEGKLVTVENAEGSLNLPVANVSKHTTRRESIHQGLKVLHHLQRSNTVKPGILALEASLSSKRSCSDESPSSSEDAVCRIAEEERMALEKQRRHRLRNTILQSVQNEAPDSLDSEEEKEMQGVLGDMDGDSLSELGSARHAEKKHSQHDEGSAGYDDEDEDDSEEEESSNDSEEEDEEASEAEEENSDEEEGSQEEEDETETDVGVEEEGEQSEQEDTHSEDSSERV